MREPPPPYLDTFVLNQCLLSLTMGTDLAASAGQLGVSWRSLRQETAEAQRKHEEEKRGLAATKPYVVKWRPREPGMPISDRTERDPISGFPNVIYSLVSSPPPPRPATPSTTDPLKPLLRVASPSIAAAPTSPAAPAVPAASASPTPQSRSSPLYVRRRLAAHPWFRTSRSPSPSNGERSPSLGIPSMRSPAPRIPSSPPKLPLEGRRRTATPRPRNREHRAPIIRPRAQEQEEERSPLLHRIDALFPIESFRIGVRRRAPLLSSPGSQAKVAPLGRPAVNRHVIPNTQVGERSQELTSGDSTESDDQSLRPTLDQPLSRRPTPSHFTQPDVLPQKAVSNDAGVAEASIGTARTTTGGKRKLSPTSRVLESNTRAKY